MKRIGKFLTIFAVAMTLFPINARAAELLIPVGKIVGLQLSDNTVTVAAFDDVLGAEARTAGLKIGDEIEVEVLEFDAEHKRITLSRKSLLEKPANLGHNDNRDE